MNSHLRISIYADRTAQSLLITLSLVSKIWRIIIKFFYILNPVTIVNNIAMMHLHERETYNFQHNMRYLADRYWGADTDAFVNQVIKLPPGWPAPSRVNG